MNILSSSKVLSRRQILKGVGIALALPFLEAMTPFVSLKGTASLDWKSKYKKNKRGRMQLYSPPLS